MNINKIRNDIRNHEDVYKQITTKEYRKDWGQFFTPPSVAKWMAAWVIDENTKTVLDPSIGVGSLAIEILSINPKIKLVGIDKDSSLIEKIPSSLKSQITLINEDFLKYKPTEPFDGIIANPPYIRHHTLNLSNDIYENLEAKIGLKISRLTNLYILFCIEIIDKIKEGGKAAIIIPNEWMNANFGTSFKKYLSNLNSLKSIIYISHDALVFDDALTTASILLIHKNSIPKTSVDFIYVKNKEYFEEISKPLKRTYSSHKYHWDKLLNLKKWDSLFSQKERKNSTELLMTIGEICKSRRGIATGANDFFHLSNSVALMKKLSTKFLKPCIGSSSDVKGLIFTEDDYKILVKNDKRVLLYDATLDLSEADRNYVEYGESLGLNKRYLTASRNLWHQQEQRPAAPIWIGVFNRNKVKVIFNQAKLFNLTTFHGLYPKENLSELQVKGLVALLNHQDMMTFIMEQRRVYGGGLSKLEPKDIIDIRIPDIRKFSTNDLKELIDELLLADQAARLGNDYLFKFKLDKFLQNKEVKQLGLF